MYIKHKFHMFCSNQWARKRNKQFNIVYIINLFMRKDYCAYQWINNCTLNSKIIDVKRQIF